MGALEVSSKLIKVEFEGIELRSVSGINRELAWRIVGNGPYKHRPSKPRIFQDDLKAKVRGVGRNKAGRIYKKLVKGQYLG